MKGYEKSNKVPITLDLPPSCLSRTSKIKKIEKPSLKRNRTCFNQTTIVSMPRAKSMNNITNLNRFNSGNYGSTSDVGHKHLSAVEINQLKNRQRLEIYALNKLMTELELSKFHQNVTRV